MCSTPRGAESGRAWVDSLPALTGASEKQIKYGEDVRKKFLESFDIDVKAPDDVMHIVELSDGRTKERPNYEVINRYEENVENQVSKALRFMTYVEKNSKKDIGVDNYETDFNTLYDYRFNKRGFGGLTKLQAKAKLENQVKEGKNLAVKYIKKYAKYMTDSRDWIDKYKGFAR